MRILSGVLWCEISSLFFYDAVKSVSTDCEMRINLFLNRGIHILELRGGEIPQNVHERVLVYAYTNRRMLKYMRNEEAKKEDPSVL